MTDHEKLKAMMEEKGLNYHGIAKITGLAYDSVKNQCQPNKPFPKWLKVALHVWESK